MLVTNSLPVFALDMEDPPGYMGTRSPRATDFSIAAIIGRSAKAAEVLKLKGRHGRFAGSTIRPLGKKKFHFIVSYFFMGYL